MKSGKRHARLTEGALEVELDAGLQILWWQLFSILTLRLPAKDHTEDKESQPYPVFYHVNMARLIVWILLTLKKALHINLEL